MLLVQLRYCRVNCLRLRTSGPPSGLCLQYIIQFGLCEIIGTVVTLCTYALSVSRLLRYVLCTVLLDSL